MNTLVVLYQLAKRYSIVENKKVKVAIQGLSKNFEPTGSYEVVDIGVFSLCETINLLKNMPKKYPRNLVKQLGFCPASILLNTRESMISISLLDDDTYYIDYTDKVSGWNYEKNIEGIPETIGFVTKILLGTIDEKTLEKPRYYIRICMKKHRKNEALWLLLDLDNKTLDNIPFNNIVRIELFRKKPVKPPKIKIVYTEYGLRRSVEYRLFDETLVDKYFRALHKVFGDKVVLK